MTVIHYEVMLGHEKVSGSIEVDDTLTAAEVDALVLNHVISTGQLSYSWSEDPNEASLY